ETLVGTPYRFHGRNAASGLDCVGLLAAAMAKTGRSITLPTGYGLRLADLSTWLPDVAQCGFADAQPPLLPGDVALFVPGPGQFHLAIAANGGGWIHAHAGLRRVVRDPQPAGAILRCWRPLPAF
ncbi:MAG: C40 family peptidase, partial [Sphingomonadales bacterium]|nr:C40 family peptidase [Sphingomonadales bacterium]